jgi:hypothetical protein
MSISLSGGDIAFIAAFIVLPLIILASCVWAIVAIRSGALLRQHAAATSAADDATAMTAVWPYAEHDEVAAAQPDAWRPDATATGTAEHTLLASADTDTRAADAPLDNAAAITTSDGAHLHEPIQETGEFPLVHHDWSQPSVVDEHVAASTEPIDTRPAQTSAPATPDVESPPSNDDANVKIDSESGTEDEANPEVETWDTTPEPEPASAEPPLTAALDNADGVETDAAVDSDTNADSEAEDDEPTPDELFQQTTDRPPLATVKRKPARKAVAQLRPPVAATGRSRLRPSAIRRPGDAPEASSGSLAGEDEGTVQGDDGAVDVGSADHE